MSVLFNHTIRHGIGSVNPIRLVRQSAKRKEIPLVLTPDEIKKLIATLLLKESTLVFLDVGTGLRMSELFGLKWGDVRFATGEISVIRAIVQQVVGPCKTEASQKPIPMDPCLAEALAAWLEHSKYRSPGDWVFASPKTLGRRPYWGQSIMRNVIRPTAVNLGISRRIGWHTLRHTYSTLFAGNGCGYQGDAGTVTACLCQGNPRHIHPGNHRTEADCPKCRGQVVSRIWRIDELTIRRQLCPFMPTE
jgi:integrase